MLAPAARGRTAIVARAGVLVSAAALLLSVLLLAAGMLRGEFAFDYVAAHSDRSLAWPLRLTALWAGEPGAVLLWDAFASFVASAVVIQRWRRSGRREEFAVALVGAPVVLLTAVLLSTARPFAMTLPAPLDGHGLHPQLRHWAMILHPPALLLGSALSIVPLAIAGGAMLAGQTGRHWARDMRRWALASWLCTGIGMALGAAWAYTQLGWGGYWAWDAVENAALLPWLAGTALLHAVTVFEQRGILKGWTVGLSAAVFLLTLVGAAITRSGAVQSVHTFVGSTSGPIFALAAGASVALAGLLWRRHRAWLAAAEQFTAASREGMTVVGIVLLSVMATAVLLGTGFPVITRLLASTSVSLEQGFFRRTVGPAGLALAFLMAISPILVYGKSPRIKKAAAMAATVGAVTGALLCVAAGPRSPVLALCGAILALTLLVAAWDAWKSIRSFARASGYGWVAAALRILDGNHRRYGGQIAHAGLAILAVGIAGSRLGTRVETAVLAPGESALAAGRTLRLERIVREKDADGAVIRAHVSESLGAGAAQELDPERRYFAAFGEISPSAAVGSGWMEDVYLTLEGIDQDRASISVRVIPLVRCVWMGAAIVAVGGLFSLLPRLLPRPKAIDFDAAPPRCCAAVEVCGLMQEMGGRSVLRGIDLAMAPGSFVVVLGANGAGKSTLLRALSGLITPTSGSVAVFGEPPSRSRSRLGYIGHELMLYRDLTVWENLSTFARLYGVPEVRTRVGELLDRFGLTALAGKQVRRLSRGQAQRVSLARALLHRPDLVIADEPFTGLDAEWTAGLRAELCALRAAGCTVVLTHHDPREAIRLGGRVVLLSEGRVILDRISTQTSAAELECLLEASA